MAVPLIFNSCLFEEALDNAVNDYQEFKRAEEEQDKLKYEWEEEVERDRAEKERAGEPFEPEPKEWEEIKEKPFDVNEERYVVCLDTLG